MNTNVVMFERPRIIACDGCMDARKSIGVIIITDGLCGGKYEYYPNSKSFPILDNGFVISETVVDVEFLGYENESIGYNRRFCEENLDGLNEVTAKLKQFGITMRLPINDVVKIHLIIKKGRGGYIARTVCTSDLGILKIETNIETLIKEIHGEIEIYRDAYKQKNIDVSFDIDVTGEYADYVKKKLLSKEG